MSLVALLPAACTQDRQDAVKLDGSPRIPDVEGVVRRVDLQSLELTDGRRFTFDRTLQSVSTYTLEPLPILGSEGQFVQMGVDGKKVRWIASVASVVRGSPPSVFYTGRLLRVEDERLIFQDGTTFRMGDRPPDRFIGSFVVVEIDPDEARVRKLSRT